jgi:hypothetical protein
MKNLYLLFLGLVISAISQSQVSQINDTLFAGGEIRTYAKSSNCIIVGNRGGMFKTTNNGQTWQNVSQNFNPFSANCDQIVSLGNDFYALTQGFYHNGLYKSIDNGTTWTQLSSPLWWINTIGKLGSELYIVGADANGLKLFSTTNGINWTPKTTVWNGTWYGGNLKLLSLSPNKLYLLREDSLFYTIDGTNLQPISFNGLNASNFYDDEFGGDNYDNLYFRESNSIYKYNFSTNTWINISSGKLPSGYNIIECSFTESTIYALIFNQSIMSIKLYKSTNQGTTFSELVVQNATFPFFRNIIEASSGSLIANGIYDEIYISNNNGINWIKPSTNFYATNADNLQLCGNTLILSRETIGIIRSDNQGASWTMSNNGLPGFSNIAYFIDDIFEVKNNLFSINNDFNTGKQYIYKSTNNGNSWTLLNLPSPYNNNEGIMFAGKCDSALFLNYIDPSSYNVGVIVSFDFGNTWIKPNNQNNFYRTFFKGNSNCLFAFNSTSDWDDFDNIYKANNFGQSFTDISNYLTNNNLVVKRSQQGKHGDKGNAVMDFDPQNNYMPIFVLRDKMYNKDVLYKFNIATNTWTLINTYGLPANYLVNAIKHIGFSRWLLATNIGLYISIDDGYTWHILHYLTDWQQGMEVNQIHYLGQKAYLGTISNGIWVVDVETGLVENSSPNEISIYPNPTSDNFNIILPDNFAKDAYISLYSIEGKLLKKERISGLTYNFSMTEYPKGSYIVNITTEGKTTNKLLLYR